MLVPHARPAARLGDGVGVMAAKTFKPVDHHVGEPT
jgi:hypothetical protein